jgi:hypothetical protein
MELLSAEVRPVGRPHDAAVVERVAQGQPLAFDALGRERIVVGDARDGAGELPLLVREQHVRRMYTTVQIVLFEPWGPKKK